MPTVPDADHPVIRHMHQVRQAMLARDAALLNRITRDYMRAYYNLRTEIKALQQAIKQANPAGKGDLVRLAALENLLDGVRREIGKFAAILAENLDDAIRLEIQMAGLDAYGFVQAGLPGFETARLALEWARLDPKAIYNLYGFLDPDGPLFAQIRLQFSQDVAEEVRQVMVSGYIQGMNPVRIAGLIRQATGSGLTWALNMARTANIWAYRVATHQNYLNNSKIVRGWYWMAALDRRVCLGCVAQHGSLHPLTEILNDHHLGRCFPVPVLATYADLGIEGVAEPSPLQITRGEDWFKALPAKDQREMMGPAMYKAWQSGAFDFGQLSKTYTSPVYGLMQREASLKEILGDKVNLYYGSK